MASAIAEAAVINNNSGEMISNAYVAGQNFNRLATVGACLECIVESYDSLDWGPIANLFVSEGKPGQILRIELQKRIGEQPSLRLLVGCW